MTTVLIDFKERKIVADNQTTYSKVNGEFLGTSGEDYFYPEKSNKVHPIGDGAYFVGSGDAFELDRQLAYIIKSKKFLTKPKSSVKIAIVRRKNEGLLVDVYEAQKSEYLGIKSWKKVITQGNYQVITFGSGGDYAAGAFMGGCSAEASVIAASKCDISTGLGITVVEVNDGHE